MRQFIFKNNRFQLDELTIFPLTVTYLETLGGKHAYTSNIVGLTNDMNPFIILFNDFIIQFYESDKSIKFDSFNGLNDEATFQDNINLNEQRFLISIINDKKRKEILDVITDQKVKETLMLLEYTFITQFQRLYNLSPPNYLKEQFINGFVRNINNNYLNYTANQIEKYANNFFASLRFR